ncbi:uncharacterized protein LOC144349483 isoform X1 [Saccoglossus kowalevskii]
MSRCTAHGELGHADYCWLEGIALFFTCTVTVDPEVAFNWRRYSVSHFEMPFNEDNDTAMCGSDVSTWLLPACYLQTAVSVDAVQRHPDHRGKRKIQNKRKIWRKSKHHDTNVVSRKAPHAHSKRIQPHRRCKIYPKSTNTDYEGYTQNDGPNNVERYMPLGRNADRESGHSSSELWPRGYHSHEPSVMKDAIPVIADKHRDDKVRHISNESVPDFGVHKRRKSKKDDQAPEPYIRPKKNQNHRKPNNTTPVGYIRKTPQHDESSILTFTCKEVIVPVNSFK